MRLARLSVCFVTACALTVLSAMPANAADLVGLNQYKVSSTGGSVTGYCAYATTLPGPSFNTIRVVITYQVQADAPAWAVGGVCEVRNLNGGTGSVSYGSVSASGPGIYAANAGYVDVPRDIKDPVTCNVPEAIFTDGTEGNPRNLRKCQSL